MVRSGSLSEYSRDELPEWRFSRMLEILLEFAIFFNFLQGNFGENFVKDQKILPDFLTV